ncbi:hypothetical protein M3P05_04420 [Sansalvadorimonas sp. 2012CJ34-2]|uniref:Uncharacterized protein n=1 Tax=Parendozoicomonas callyspongiae TaxID=2942213 RepID=A0ABT0PF71_9GAMM|nr:hypothetical protein [Sansalvadorimonas sp. 2012CJ34-2]MCL6269188.1 hypothetical protein [Sansalvadorimonas sp. 2012CJ34-2]
MKNSSDNVGQLMVDIRKLLLLSLCFALYKTSAWASEEGNASQSDIVTSNLDSFSKFLKFPSKYWSTGIAVGQVGNVCHRGLVVKTKEMDFYEGGGTKSGNERFHPIRTQVSTYSDEVFSSSVKASPDQAVVASYVHPFPLYPFHWTESKYWIQKIEPVKSNFAETESYRKFGNQFTQPPGVRHGLYGKGMKRGQIRHVSRWGLFFGKMCTCYLHEGGMETITEDNITTQQSKVTPLNIFSDKGCQFAEDAVRSESTVSVGYSQKLFDIWNAHPHIVQSIRVEDSLKQ